MDGTTTQEVTKRLPLVWCQRRLAVLWLGGAAVLVLLMIVQTMGNKYGDAAADAWGWLLPTVVPTLSLIVGAFAAAARQKADVATVDRFSYRLTFWLSAAYLVLVVIVPLAQPLTGRPPLELMQLSKLWLEAVQGIVGIALGVYFVSGSA
jgi:hypothetical protein